MFHVQLLIICLVSVVSCVENCEISCPSVISPICGKHYHTGKQVFTNECLMRRYNCEKHTKYFRIPLSLCQREYDFLQQNTMQVSFMSNKRCKWSCILEHNPLCSWDRKTTRTFLNECLMKLHNCEFRTNFRKIHNGQCFE